MLPDFKTSDELLIYIYKQPGNKIPGATFVNCPRLVSDFLRELLRKTWIEPCDFTEGQASNPTAYRLTGAGKDRVHSLYEADKANKVSRSDVLWNRALAIIAIIISIIALLKP